MQRLLAIVCLLVVAVSCRLESTITLSSASYSAGDELLVDWSLVQRTGPGSYVGLNTPVEGAWNSYMFTIVNEHGQSAEYQGRIYKRRVTFDDYFSVTENEPRTGQLTLSEGYKFYAPGTYQVTMEFYAIPLFGESFLVQSNTVEVVVVHPDIQIRSQVLEMGGSRAVNFNGCSNGETSTVNTAIDNAISASANAESYLNAGGSSSSSAYTKWFGTYSSSNWNTVKSHFVNINNLLASKNFGIDCTCNQPGTYAYVYPADKSHTIYLCPVFWDAGSNPYTYNSQPGTLSHEASHFNDVAATGDYQYGVSGCLELASNPSVAIKNADSHEYFQESNP